MAARRRGGPFGGAYILAAVAIVRILVQGVLDGLGSLARATRYLEGLKGQALMGAWARLAEPTQDDTARTVEAMLVLHSVRHGSFVDDDDDDDE